MVIDRLSVNVLWFDSRKTTTRLSRIEQQNRSKSKNPQRNRARPKCSVRLDRFRSLNDTMKENSLFSQPSSRYAVNEQIANFVINNDGVLSAGCWPAGKL